jgi:hypothetical protein
MMVKWVKHHIQVLLGEYPKAEGVPDHKSGAIA